MSRLMGKRILITGASVGIGAALAREMARRGAHLGLLARREIELNQISGELSKQYPNQIFCFHRADVCQEAELESAMETLIERLGGLDIVIANSGIGETRSAFSSRHWTIARDTLQVNLLGAIHTLEIAKNYLAKHHRPGQLVAISSVAAVRGFPRSAAYCASKAGLTTYLESIRGELQSGGITVTSIHPGYIRTAMTARNNRMPWLMDADEAARRITRAIEAGKKRYIFPGPMRIIFWSLKHLPDWVYDLWSAASSNGNTQKDRNPAEHAEKPVSESRK